MGNWSSRKDRRENWASKHAKESDESYEYKLLNDIDILKNDIQKLSDKDLDQKAEKFEKLIRKYNSLFTCLHDDSKVEEVSRELTFANEQLTRIKIRISKNEIGQLKGRYGTFDNSELEAKVRILEEIINRCNFIITNSWHEDEKDDAEEEQIRAEGELAKVQKYIEYNRIAKVNEDSVIDGDTPKPVYNRDGNVEGFSRDDER